MIRLDASLFTPEERARVQQLIELAQREEHPSLKGADGLEIQLPVPIHRLLLRILTHMRYGRALVLIPEDEPFTTQAAANFLGVSRQYLVNLLESGEIPHDRAGPYRRVSLKDLRDYAKKRDAARSEGLRKLFQEVRESGKYEG